MIAERESTNSITHLVKIVAREEIKKKHLDLLKVVQSLAREQKRMKLKINELSRITDCKIAALAYSYKIKKLPEEENIMENAGDPWNFVEDNLLSGEINSYVNTLATQHSRSADAIRTRIRHLHRNNKCFNFEI